MARVILLFLVLLWSGMIIGISFMAMPLKFHAASLTLAVGVDVGRHISAFFDKVHWAFIVILVSASVCGGITGRRSILVLLIVLCQLMQSLWLLPVLSVRAEQVISGYSVAGSIHHGLFGLVELLKLLALLYFAWTIVKPLIKERVSI